MGLVIPNEFELAQLQSILNTALTLKLYGNNKIPDATDTTAAYTEIAGGGYVSIALVFATWTITAGEPTTAKYPIQTWTFTGPINSPGSIFGYFVTRNSDGKLLWAERFPAANIPFSPINGSKIILKHKVTLESQF